MLKVNVAAAVLFISLGLQVSHAQSTSWPPARVELAEDMPFNDLMLSDEADAAACTQQLIDFDGKRASSLQDQFMRALLLRLKARAAVEHVESGAAYAIGRSFVIYRMSEEASTYTVRITIDLEDIKHPTRKFEDGNTYKQVWKGSITRIFYYPWRQTTITKYADEMVTAFLKHAALVDNQADRKIFHTAHWSTYPLYACGSDGLFPSNWGVINVNDKETHACGDIDGEHAASGDTTLSNVSNQKRAIMVETKIDYPNVILAGGKSKTRDELELVS